MDIRRIPVCAKHSIASPRLTVELGDQIELRRKGPDVPWTVAVLSKDGGKVSITLETAESIFKDGVLGRIPRDYSGLRFGLVLALPASSAILLFCYVAQFLRVPLALQAEFTWRDVYAALTVGVIGFIIGLILNYFDKKAGADKPTE